MLCYTFPEEFIDLVNKVENGEITEEEFEERANALVSEEEVPEPSEDTPQFCNKSVNGTV